MDELLSEGYAQRTIKKKRRAARAFLKWLHQEHDSVVQVNESHVVAFLGRMPERSKEQLALERPAVYGFLKHFRTCHPVVGRIQGSSKPEVSPHEKAYIDYLRNDRGLTERSINVYRPLAEEIIDGLSDATGSPPLRASFVREFFLERVSDRSVPCAKLLATVLRSFLRFLFSHGETDQDFSLVVPSVSQCRLAPVHSFFSIDEVERILSSPDLTTSGGRRDYAILLLLARLGLRAGEIVRLELEDIHWRAAEIVVTGKGRILDRLPLLSDVGEALSLYIRKDREPVESRRVFLRKNAPRTGLTGPASIGHVVRTALARAEIQRSSRGAAHLFRHTLATRMIQQGASLEEIAEVLRHRSPGTTEIYAKVDFETLRGAARAWPGTESER